MSSILCFSLQLLAIGSSSSNYFNFLTLKPSGAISNSASAVSKSVVATTNWIDAYYSLLYVFPKSESQALAVLDCGDSGKEEWSDNMFELHQPYVPIHNAGLMQPLMVEAAFYQKWLNYYQNKNDDLVTYEPFFDHSFALYKSDISENIEVVQNQDNSNLKWEILYTFFQWDLIEEIDGKNTFISLLLYIPTTQVTIELITEYTSDYDQYLENEVIFTTEPRMSFKRFADFTYPWDNIYTVVPIKQSRAVTDLETNVAWYVEYLGAEVIMSGETEVNGRTVKYTNLNLNYGAAFEIGLYERSSEDSYGEFTLETYETGINSVHRDYITSSACGFNRWFDNHYALTMLGKMYQNEFKMIYDNIKASGQRYILFAFTKEQADENAKSILEQFGIDYWFLLYAIEPNGNTIEIVGYFEDDELASSTVEWDGQFCPEICKDATTFTKNFIDNGQYTEYGKTLDKYAGTLVDDDDTQNKSKKSFSISIITIFALIMIGIVIYILLNPTRSLYQKTSLDYSTNEIEYLKKNYGSTV